jgi:hypothetical protein
MMDLREITMKVNGKRVELPEGIGLMLSAKLTKPVRILAAISMHADGPEPNVTWCPCPVRLEGEDVLTIYHRGLRVTSFVSHRGIAIDPIERERVAPAKHKRRLR